eukprot:1567885-Alexandrium_andersonii.AAC.1
MEIGAIATSNNKFSSFCKKKGHLESECRKKKAKTSGGDSKPSNPNKDEACSYCHKKGASSRSASASTDGPL